jgi:adenylate cyclase
MAPAGLRAHHRIRLLADGFLVDILFTEPSSYGQEDDMVLGDAIAKAANVYLPFFLSVHEKAMAPDDIAYLKRFAVTGGPPPGPRYRSVVAPVDAIRRGVKGSGNVAISPDGDGVYRRVPLAFTLAEMTLPSLTFSWFTGRGGANMDPSGIILREKTLPLTEGKLLLRFPRGKRPFTVVPAIDVLSAYRGTVPPQGANLSRDFFKGKVVFLGMTAPGLLDLKSTPTMTVSTVSTSTRHSSRTSTGELSCAPSRRLSSLSSCFLSASSSRPSCSLFTP